MEPDGSLPHSQVPAQTMVLNKYLWTLYHSYSLTPQLLWCTASVMALPGTYIFGQETFTQCCGN